MERFDLIKVKLACVILIYCTCLVFAFHFFENVPLQFQFHPLQPHPFKYELKWYLVYVSDTSRPFWCMTAFALVYNTGFLDIRPKIGSFYLRLSILHFYIIYELVLHLDFMLTFRQSPARLIIGFFYVIIVTYYYLTYFTSRKLVTK